LGAIAPITAPARHPFSKTSVAVVLPSEAPVKKRLLWRIVAGVTGAAILLAALLGLWFWRVVADGVAILEGQTALAGLQFPVEIARDKAGVPTLTAGNLRDLVRALGFLHAQERFFQMDTMRRSSAGELSALAGRAAVSIDRAHRVHRFRARAQSILAQMPAEQRSLLAAYTEGVNAGLAALGRRPFEYTLLRALPEPWQVEDTLLVIYAMYFQLQDSSGWVQRRKALADQVLGTALADFLYPGGEAGDAALDGSILPLPPMPEGPAPSSTSISSPAPPPPNGSNAFAVSALKSKTGSAIVANDMHLPLRVPNIWYRARLKAGRAAGESIDLTGVTLPGVPLLVAGSNGKIAWGFTDAYIATTDAIKLIPARGDPRGYLTPSGPLPLSVITEKICAARAGCEDLEVEESIWGPVVAREADGSRIVLRWAAHDTNAISFEGLLAFETAGTVRQAFDAAHRAGLPQQNLIAADREGHIGWTIMGQIPRRVGFEERRHSWADGSRAWQGYLSAGEIPELIDPQGGLIWSANNRAVGGHALALLGDGGYASASRAKRIRDDLKAKDKFGEPDLLAIQLDVHAPDLDPWQRLLVDLLQKRQDAFALAALGFVKDWDGAAAPGSVGYRLVRSFEEEAIALIYGGFGGPIKSLAGPEAGTMTARRPQDPSLRLLSEKPKHLVPPPFQSWQDAMDALYDHFRKRVRAEGGDDLKSFTWGRRNHSAIHHPLAAALPILGLLTDPPDVPIPGDTLVPRAAAPGYGSSERFVISPGRESEGIFEMPAGQAGNPLSPYYLAGHSDWAGGQPSAFLPGAPRWTLVLIPGP
jgi:penicillin amidase